MKNIDIAFQRLHNQRIVGTTFEKPAEVVRCLVSVQAQDYLGALWALGLRLPDAIEADIEQALVDRTIIRTWPMRGTLHFVAAEDARWMLELMTPRIVARNANRLQQQYDLDDAVFAQSKEVLIRVLQGGKQLLRDALYRALEAEHISASNHRGLHILWRLAQEGLICFGTREGKQQTFVLLDEWAPNAKSMDHEEALAELAQRYFTGHGPATVQDFGWWSGLTAADARTGLEMVKPQLIHEIIESKTYWMSSHTPTHKISSPSVHLLPAFDEYTVAYKDRSAVLNPLYASLANSGNGILSPAIVIDGQIAGTWKRNFIKDAVVITPYPFTTFTDTEKHALTTAANRYGIYLKMPVILS
jgi:Winged helix DNA-binding domain